MDKEPEHSRGIQRKLIDYYSVCYVIEEKRMIIIKVLYSASDIKHRLRCENIFDIASCFTESFLFSRSS